MTIARDFKAQQQHVAAALAALHAEQAKEGKDCPDVRGQRDEDICTGQVAEAADRNLAIFYDNLKAIIDGEAQKKLQDSQNAWLDYRKKACDAVYEFYKDGTIRNSEQARCQTRLTRDRMRALDSLYETPLHH
jgi:uncharacterized protein YecT (DUF1311 family)